MKIEARPLRRIGHLLVVMAGLTLLAGLLGPGAAGAAGSAHLSIDIVGQGGGFTTHPAGPLVDTAGLVPGTSASGTMGIRDDTAGPVDLYLRLVGIVNDGNGCTPVGEAVDHTCGPGQNDLASTLVFTIAVSRSERGDYVPTWTGTAAQLAGAIAFAQALPVGTSQWVRLSASLPPASGNKTQTDTFAFGVRVEAHSGSGAEGIDIGPGGTTGGTNSHKVLGLASTGEQLGYLVAAGVLLIAAGLVLTIDVRRGRRRTRD
jgi:hypothetical protein